MAFRAIIIGSNSATRLSLIRCVGAIKGCRVTIINMVFSSTRKQRRPLDAFSKYVDTVLYAKKFDANGLASLLLNKCRIEGEKPIVFSVDDDSASLIDTIQDSLKDSFYFSHINHQPGSIAALMDKSVQKSLASQHGFNVAESWTVDISDGSYVIPQEISYPCYVKGRLSYHSAKQFQKRCDSREDLEEWLDIVEKNNPSPLIVERFLDVKKEFGVLGFSDSQTVKIPCIVDLQDGGHGMHRGVSAFGIVNDLASNEELKTQIEGLIKSIGLTGMFNIDLVEAEGKLFFVEVNFRFAAYGYAVCEAGVNVPAMQVAHFLPSISDVSDRIVNSGLSYVNERVAIDDVIAGYRSWKNYKQLLRKANCRLVFHKGDNTPNIVFGIQVIESYLSNRLRRLIHR